MLRKEFRFHRQNRVKRVYQKGKTVKAGPFSLKYYKQPRPEGSKAAVVVSKKVDKRAVARNRIRRRVYEILRTKWDEVEAGYDLVFTIFDPEVGSVEHKVLVSRIDKLLSTAGLLKKTD